MFKKCDQSLLDLLKEIHVGLSLCIIIVAKMNFTDLKIAANFYCFPLSIKTKILWNSMSRNANLQSR